MPHDVEKFTELRRIEAVIKKYRSLMAAEIQTLAEVPVGNRKLPIYGLVIGSENPSHPTFGLFAGVHGLEKVGTHLVLYYLDSLAAQIRWDEVLLNQLRQSRLVAIPLINPGGMLLRHRSNPNGVDLMRNSPVDAIDPVPFLLGGHRLSPLLPWFRGWRGDPMEIENQALADFVQREMFQAEAALSLDIHSGYGAEDRLWHPYGKTAKPFASEKQAQRIEHLLESVHPYHVYMVEPQWRAYLIHGDIWDYLYDLHREQCPSKVYIPWTLEMGSWRWLKKNPFQLFSLLGPFNPMRIHRYKRIMRRHRLLIEFLFRITFNYKKWKNPN